MDNDAFFLWLSELMLLSIHPFHTFKAVFGAERKLHKWVLKYRSRYEAMFDAVACGIFPDGVCNMSGGFQRLDFSLAIFLLKTTWSILARLTLNKATPYYTYFNIFSLGPFTNMDELWYRHA